MMVAYSCQVVHTDRKRADDSQIRKSGTIDNTSLPSSK